MLGDISWRAFAAAVMAFILVWYGFLFFRYGSRNFISILIGRAGKRPSARKKEKGMEPFSEYDGSFDTLEDAKELYGKLLDAFIESDDRNISKAEFKHYVQFLLAEYPYVRQSVLRGKINSLMVLQSNRYPSLQLSDQEMDSLWKSTDKK